jgi:hypothetical protein
LSEPAFSYSVRFLSLFVILQPPANSFLQHFRWGAGARIKIVQPCKLELEDAVILKYRFVLIFILSRLSSWPGLCSSSKKQYQLEYFDRRNEWLDLNAVDVMEYTVTVWAKVEGSWWPAQIIEEYHRGVHKPIPGFCLVALTSSEVQSTLKSEFIKAWEPNFDSYAHFNKFVFVLITSLSLMLL